MGLVDTEGIVLRKYNLSDADRIVLVLTEKQGLIRGVAQGAKRLKSRFHSSLEFFSRVRISYFQKEEQELVSIRDTELIESAFDRLSQPEYFEAFAEMGDLLVRLTPLYEPHQRLYNMVRHCLLSASKRPDGLPAVRLYFEIWLLKLSGFLPSWEECSKCGRSLTDREPKSLSLEFEIECGRCGKPQFSVSETGFALFNSAQRMGPDRFIDRYAAEAESIEGLGAIVSRISDAVLERIPQKVIPGETGKAA